MLTKEEDAKEIFCEENPGLMQRFNAVVFEDYSDLELLQVLDAQIKEHGLRVKYDARLAALSVLAQQRVQPNFGNGVAVANIVSRAMLHMSERNRNQVQSLELLPQDFHVEVLEHRNSKVYFLSHITRY